MALAGTPARYNKSFSVIRQYGPTFATAHGGIQYDCGASGGGIKNTKLPVCDFNEKVWKLLSP
jgi:hypothetical protein